MQSAQHRSAHHCKLPAQAQGALLGRQRCHHRWIRNARAQGRVWMRAVVMRYPFLWIRSQVQFRDSNQPVRALTPNCFDHSLVDLIDHRGARRELQHRQPRPSAMDSSKRLAKMQSRSWRRCRYLSTQSVVSRNRCRVQAALGRAVKQSTARSCAASPTRPNGRCSPTRGGATSASCRR